MSPLFLASGESMTLAEQRLVKSSGTSSHQMLRPMMTGRRIRMRCRYMKIATNIGLSVVVDVVNLPSLDCQATPKFQPTRERGANAVPYTVAVYASWGICSIIHQKKSVFGCSIPNRLSLEAT